MGPMVTKDLHRLQLGSRRLPRLAEGEHRVAEAGRARVPASRAARSGRGRRTSTAAGSTRSGGRGAAQFAPTKTCPLGAAAAVDLRLRSDPLSPVPDDLPPSFPPPSVATTRSRKPSPKP